MQHCYAALPGPKWLRLLRILSFDGEVATCSLDAFDMGDPREMPKFDCLSYTWGDPMSRHLYPDALQHEMSASCDRQIRHEDDTIIKVTENLVQALKRLAQFGYCSSADHRTPRYLWIDAICINQGDDDEKSSQVKMMGEIYGHAETVVVWLGEEDLHTPGALKTMEALANVEFDTFDEALYFDDYDAFTAFDTLIEGGRALGLPSIEAGEWRDYAAFLQRKWFERIWVLQEKFFAKKTDVFVGSHKLSWEYIITAASVLKKSRLANPLQALYLFALAGYEYYRIEGTVSRLFEDRLNNYQIFEDISQAANSPTNLETLLYHSKRLNATKPLDHVFAILDIWKSRRDKSLGLEDIEVEYKASLSEIYTKATALAIQESGNLGVLSLLESRQRAPVLPSWVPDYSQKAGIQPLIPWPRDASKKLPPQRWNSSRGLAFNYRPDAGGKSSRRLAVQGFKWDIIERVGPTYKQLDREYRWVDLLELLWDGHGQGELLSYYERFWKTLIKDSFRNQPAGEEAEEAFAALAVDRVQDLCTQVSELEDSIRILKADEGDLLQIKEQTSELDKLGPLLERSKQRLVELAERIPQISAWVKTSEDGESEKQRGIVISGRANDGCMEDVESRTACMLRDIGSSFWAAYSGRKLFRTATGYFGISDQALERGDSVWILAGAETPFVLRNAVRNEWRVVGEAYVHGVMEGEATEQLPDLLSSIVLI